MPLADVSDFERGLLYLHDSKSRRENAKVNFRMGEEL